MCLVCVDLIKQKMSIREAERNLDELLEFATNEDFDHYVELITAIEDEDYESLSQILDDGADKGC